MTLEFDEIRRAYAKLQSIEDPVKIINDEISIQNLQALSDLNGINGINLCFEYNFCRIISNLIETCYQQLLTYLLKNRPLRNDSRFLKLLKLCSTLIRIVLNFTNFSSKFIKEAHELNLIKQLFYFLKNPKLIGIYKLKQDFYMDFVIMPVIYALSNLSRMSSRYSQKWKEENAVESLIKIFNKFKSKPDCLLCFYIVLANIADDKEIENFEGIKDAIPRIIELIGLIVTSIETRINLKRQEFNTNENLVDIREIAFVELAEITLNLFELLTFLYHTTCKNTIKYEIYSIYKMNAYLRSIIYHGNEFEIEYALKMLWHLCFNKLVANDVRQDEKLMTSIKNKLQTKTHSNLIAICDDLLCLLEIKPKTITTHKTDSLLVERKTEFKVNHSLPKKIPKIKRLRQTKSIFNLERRRRDGPDKQTKNRLQSTRQKLPSQHKYPTPKIPCSICNNDYAKGAGIANHMRKHHRQNRKK